MRILYISQYFPPETGAPAARVSELARHWTRAGHQVTVLTGFPNHPTGVVHPDYRSKMRRLVYRESMDGVQVVRTWLAPLPNGKPLERMLNYSSFSISAALTGLALPRPDVVIATSPQLLVGLDGWWLGALKRTPFVFEVRDLWPESISAVGVSGDSSLMIRSLRTIADFLYRKADRVVVVTPAFREELVGAGRVSTDRISLVENGVETELFSPTNGSDLRTELGLENRFIVSYIGTVGMAHDLETVLRAAACLQSRLPEAALLIAGEGSEKQMIISQAEAMGLSNVRFLGQQPRNRIPSLIKTSDACLVTLRESDVFKTVIPTKMLEFMSCARPVVCNVQGQARRILEEAAAGVCVPSNDPFALAEAVISLHRDQDLRAELGSAGREYICRRYSRERTAQTYLRVLEKVRKRWREVHPRVREAHA